jgi:hypothetical protein
MKSQINESQRQCDRELRIENRGQSTNLDRLAIVDVGVAVARAVRIEYGGAFYHVMARGNRRERIFRDEADRVGEIGVSQQILTG